MKSEVALILDTDFTKDLQKLASEMPVWIVKSHNNAVMVKELRLQSNSYQLTEVFSEQLESNSNVFYRIIDTLDEHHNEVSQDPPYNTLLVYGLDLEAIDINILRELGFIKFQKTEYGFIAIKEESNH